MKRTFKEWETDMCDAIKHINDARTNVVLSLFSRVWNHNDQLHDTWMKSMDGLNALERQLTGELSRARRKHIKRQKTMCQCCGEQRASWRTENGQYLCTGCACSRCDIRTRVPRCECCGTPLYGLTVGWRSDDTSLLYCSIPCALEGRGCEPMTVDEEDGQ